MKTLDMIDNNVGDLIEKFAVKGKVKLIGSNQQRGLLFTSDYDIMTKLKGRAEILANYFKRVMQEIPKKEYYFMDFKSGLDKRLIYDFDEDNLKEYLKNPLIPKSYKNKILDAKGEDRVKLIRDLFILRWTPQDIMNGYVNLIDGAKYDLVDALQDNTIIKLDIIIPVGNMFAEVSENYIYRQDEPDTKQIIQDLADDIEKYRHKNTMKSLKRLYSIISLKNPDDKRLLKLEEFFNSQYGLINKVAGDFDLLLLLNEKHNIPWNKLYDNMQLLKERLALTDKVSRSKILKINKINATTFKKEVTQLIDYLRGLINPQAKKLLSSI